MCGWRGFGSIRSWLSACRRRVVVLMTLFPPFGGGRVADRGGVVPKVQTASVRTGENGWLWARWSRFWPILHVIPLRVLRAVNVGHWDCNVFGCTRIMTVGNYVRDLSGVDLAVAGGARRRYSQATPSLSRSRFELYPGSPR